MKTVGIVCEYNPFHEGHLYQMEQIRRHFGGDTQIVCLMSGDFVQRGEPAIFDKYERAKRAVEASADLVLEFPFPFSCSSAEQFASAAVSIMKELHCIDVLAFGAEEKTGEELLLIAKKMRQRNFLEKKKALRKEKKSLSYPKLIDEAYFETFKEELSLSSNEILGLCYCNSILENNNPFDIYVTTMKKGVCATKEREKIVNSEDFPEKAALSYGNRAVLTALSLKAAENFNHLFERKQDLQGEALSRNRFVINAKNAATLEELFSIVRNPTDTDANLRRELLYTLLSVKKGKEKEKPEFTVVLGADSKGEKLLRNIKREGEIEIVTKKARGKSGQIPLYLLAENFYTAFTSTDKKGSDLMKKFPYIKND